MTQLSPYRNPALFDQFLIRGYTAVTLSSVPAAEFSGLLRAKLCLGTLITLYDDFADRPTAQDPQLLEKLYKLGFVGQELSAITQPHERYAIHFAQFLFAEMSGILKRLPHYSQLLEILDFDLRQFYAANRFSSLLMAHPFLNNTAENRYYCHHNMGMVMVAVMDLMATEKIHFSEFGAIRETLLMGQRIGRIFNVLSTWKREIADGDITGELSIHKGEQQICAAEQNLKREVRELYEKVGEYESRITTFSVSSYLEGLRKIQELHEKMEGVI